MRKLSKIASILLARNYILQLQVQIEDLKKALVEEKNKNESAKCKLLNRIMNHFVKPLLKITNIIRNLFISVQPLAVQLSLSPTGRDYFQSPMVTSTSLPVQTKSSPTIITSKKPVDFSDISSLSS